MSQATLPVSLRVSLESESTPPDRPAPSAAQVIPVRRYSPGTLRRANTLTARGLPLDQVAQRLTAEGYTNRDLTPWTVATVQILLDARANYDRQIRLAPEPAGDDLTMPRLFGESARDKVDELLGEGLTFRAAAAHLNETCRRQNGKRWTRQSVYYTASEAVRAEALTQVGAKVRRWADCAPEPTEADRLMPRLSSTKAREKIDQLLAEGLAFRGVVDRLNERFRQMSHQVWDQKSIYYAASHAARKALDLSQDDGDEVGAAPTPEQIAELCSEIRRTWSEAEHRKRAGVRTQVSLRVVSPVGLEGPVAA